MTTVAPRSFNDEQRVQLATVDGAKSIGPLEACGCPHGRLYSCRYEWPRASGSGPDNGEFVVIANECFDCAVALWLRPGTRRRV